MLGITRLLALCASVDSAAFSSEDPVASSRNRRCDARQGCARTPRRSRWRRLGPLVLLAIAAACADGPAPLAPRAPPGEDAKLLLTAVVAGTAVATLVVEVTAADIPSALLFNLVVTNGVATSTLRIPPGPARTLTVRAFDDGGGITHEGSATLDVRAGQNSPVSITLVSRAGQVPITVTVGNVSVVVAPTTLSLAVGETAPLTATILDADNKAVAGIVEWATSNPAFVSVGADGQVTGLAAGSATVAATYEGVVGFAQVTVTATGPTGGTLVISEVMANPNASLDPDGEWVEIYNGTGAPVALTGWVIRNGNSQQCTLAGGAIPANGYVVVGPNTDPAANGGVSGMILCAGVPLSNTGPFTVTLLNPTLDPTVAVVHSVTFPLAIAGKSQSLDPAHFTAAATNADFCLGTLPFGAGDLGTPGSANPPCP